MLLAMAEEAEQQQEAADLLLALAEEAADLLLATAEEGGEDEAAILRLEAQDAELAQMQDVRLVLIGALFCCY